jgi:predicted nucleic acid-binding protein
MTDARAPGAVVDTMVISWLLDDRPNALADRYRDLIGPQPILLAFQTVMELRFGALRAAWAATPKARASCRRVRRREAR